MGLNGTKIQVVRQPEGLDISRLPLNILAVMAQLEMERKIPHRGKVPAGAVIRPGAEEVCFPWFSGCDLESESISYCAEEIAILQSAHAGHYPIETICVASERKPFFSCSRCLDLLKEFGTKDSLAIYFVPSTGDLFVFTLGEITSLRKE